MATFRRLAAIVGAAALAGAVVGGPARADTPEVFQGSAAGTALDLSILGKQVTLGSSSANADSTGKAEAKGAGVLTPVFSTQKTATASGSTATTDNKAKTCSQAPGLAGLQALSLGLACSSATATSGASPSATGAGSVVEAGVDASTVINTIIETIETVETTSGANLSDVKDGITNIGGTVANLLDPVCQAAQDAAEEADTAQDGADIACAATTTVQDLVTSVLKTKTLEVAVGTTTSSVDTTTSSVASKANASGAVVKLLPLPQVNGLPSTQPVVTITVGEANASATYDRGAGSATGKADPAIVRISFNTVLTDALADKLDSQLPFGQSLSNIVLTPKTLLDIEGELGEGVEDLIEPCEGGRAVCILPDTALESRIYLATSKVTKNADGSVVATADAVRMELATGVKFQEALDKVNSAAADAADLDLTGPGVRLALAGVEAGVGGSPAQVTKQNNNGGGGDGGPDNGAPALTPEQSRTLPPAELPRTGGTPWVPLVGATALALAVIGRRAAAKAIS